MERRLGKGLAALLSPEPARDEPRAEIALAQIRPNPFQPRKTFPKEALAELEGSIRKHGVLQPIVLRAASVGYELIAGERRMRAALAVGLTTIPAVVRTGVTDQSMLELALVENLQRSDLDPLEKARGLQQLIDRGQTQEQVASAVGMQRSTVSNFLRLLELSDAVQEVVSQGLLSMGHARALLGLSDPARQAELCALVVRKGLSVREVEQRIRELQGRGQPNNPGKAAVPAAAPWVRDLESRLRSHLGTKVELKNHEGYRGEIVVHYHGREDLDRLSALLAPKKTL